jgi:integrase
MLYKRKGSDNWQTEFTFRGKEIRRSTGTPDKKQAERYEEKLRADLYNGMVLGTSDRTLDDAASRWMLEKREKRSLWVDRLILDAFLSRAGKGVRLDSVSNATIADYGTDLISQHRHTTVRRHMAVIRALGNKAFEWGWLTRPWRVPNYTGEAFEPVTIDPATLDRVMAALPEHARRIATFAVETGLRRANVTKLKWSMVDLANNLAVIPASAAKGKRPIVVPLSPRAKAILEQCVGSHITYVFTDHNQRAPVGTIKKSWAKACAETGAVGFRFHDLRHHWATMHVLAGTPIKALKELGGWKSLQLVDKYTHLAAGDLAVYVANKANTLSPTLVKSESKETSQPVDSVDTSRFSSAGRAHHS